MSNNEKKPNFFIVGAPKCGTTAMYEYLRQHPDIYMPEDVKEPHFFCKDFEHPWNVKDLATYLELFSAVRHEKAIGEASVWYLYSKVAARQIKDFNSAANVIIMLRNPVDMLYSLHSQYLLSENEDIVDFESALEAEKDRRLGQKIPASRYPAEFLFYRETARYSFQIERYLKYFDHKNIHIIIFDEFVESTENSYKQLLRFLDVSDNFTPEFRIINANQRRRSTWLHNFLLSPPKTLQAIVQKILPIELRKHINKKIYEINIEQAPRKTLDMRLRKRLQAEFAPEIEKLSLLIDRDLSKWVLE